MAMKHRHALDNRIGEVQDHVHRATVWNIYGIQPRWMLKGDAVFCISQEVHLMYVERMQFGGSIDNAPMLISTYANAGHRTCVGRKLAAIDVEAVFVLGEGYDEVRCNFLQRLWVDQL